MKSLPPVLLRQRLLVIAAAGIVPLALAAGVGLAIIAHNQWNAMQARSLEVARLSAAGVDLEVDNSLATLESLAASPLLDDGELDNYRLLLERVLAITPNWHSVTLAQLDRAPLAHIGSQEAQFYAGTTGVQTFSTVLQTHAPVVGHLARDPTGLWGVPIRVPVIRDGELRYVLSAVLNPEAINKVLVAQGLPANWVVSVLDARRQRIARSIRHADYIGTSTTPSLEKLLDENRREGIGITDTLEGVQSSTAYVRLQPYGWIVAVGLPTEAVRAAVIRDFKVYAIGIAMSLLFALIATWIAARSISVPMRSLRRAAEQLGSGETPRMPRTRIREIRELGQALLVSAQTQRQAEVERRSTLVELVGAQENLRQQLDELQRVHQLSTQLLKMGSMRDQMHAVLSTLCELHEADKGLVLLHGEVDDTPRVQAAIGLSDEALEYLCARERLRVAPGTGPRPASTDPKADAEFWKLGEREGFRAVHAMPLRGSTGRALGVIAVYLRRAQGPTERQMRLSEVCAQLCSMFVERSSAEADAHRSDQRLQIALDSASVPFSVLVPVLDSRGTTVDFTWEYVNRAAAAMLDRAAATVTGRSMREAAAEIWAAPALLQICVDVLRDGQSRDWELEYLRNGEPRWLQMVITPFNGKLAVWWSDVTSRKLQEAMQKATDRRKDEFIAILAHELRNPLAPIQQATTISRSPTATEAQKRWSSDVIERQVHHMALLLDDLLDVSRITRGKLELKKQALDLRSAIDTAVETARPHFQSRDHRLHVDIAKGAIPVNADPIRVAQIITNLLTNAARYTEPGGDIHLRAAVEGSEAVVEVRDNGIGIPADHLDSIFEMFSQVRAKRSTPDSGLGIGLALARGVANLHGGSLMAASAGTGQGSQFTLRLPLSAEELPSQPQVDPRTPPRATTLRVVVADDNRDAADTLADFLRLEGHEVGVAYDGEQALQQYEALQPGVVLLDIGMPRLDGYEVARRIRALPLKEGASAPMLIALTGWGQASDKAEAEAAGFDRHLTKPVDPDELLRCLPGAAG